MSNLYARLVKGEDERTEALSDLLERVLAEDRPKFANFVFRVLLADPTDNKQKIDFQRSLTDSPVALKVETQYRIDDGAIPDMVIFSGSDPVCVVEVKIGARIEKAQLESYGRWLENKTSRGYPTALVLLTQFTDPPAGFDDPNDESYGVTLRSVASWQAVADWFAESCHVDEGVEEPLRTLAEEFSEFLREDAMPTLDDAAIARQYLAHSHRKLVQVVNNIRDWNGFPDHWIASRDCYEMPVGIYREHYPEKKRTRYVYYGLGFKPSDESDNALYGFTQYRNDSVDMPKPAILGDGFYAFVCIYGTLEDCPFVPGFTNNQWFERRGEKLKPYEHGPDADSTGWWYFSNDKQAGYGKIKALQELLDNDGRMGRELMRWTHGALEETVALWEALFPKGE